MPADETLPTADQATRFYDAPTTPPEADAPPFPAPEADPLFTPTQEKIGPGPVDSAERIGSVDMIRGFALLGILAMNIVDFGWPQAAYGNPMRGGGFAPGSSDRFIWIFNHLFFEAKMMTLFSMLFGAGLVLMGDRAEARGGSLRGLYYRRILWLLAIGLVHGYLFWGGDILVIYAECGLLLYPFRRKSPRTLIVLGTILMLIIVPVSLGIGAGLDYMKATSERVVAMEKSGQTPTRFQKRIHDAWTKQVGPNMKPDPKKQKENWDEEMQTFRGRYAGIVKHRAGRLWVEHTIAFVVGLLWFVGGRMLFGMGLMKLGVFSASRPWTFYVKLAAFGYGVGLPLVAYDAFALIHHKFSVDYFLHGGLAFNAIGSVLVALGHVGMLVLIYQEGLLTWLTRRLAAVGRMALTNYLTHSLVCTTLFYGYGFGLFGTINRTGLAGIVLAIWVAQLLISPVWLAHFRFGPAEWLWRSLTYWKPQPMRRAPEVALA
jgi:uncharacterized protein